MHNLVDVGPLQFVHILDMSTNITRLEVGPKKVVLQYNEKLSVGPLNLIIVPPGKYCCIKNPVKNYEVGKQCELKHGDVDVRFNQEPFPLYPGEILEDAERYGIDQFGYSNAIKKLPVVKANQAVRLCSRVDGMVDGVARKAGDLWQLEGPLTYKPLSDAEITGVVDAQVIGINQAIRMRAKQDLTTKSGVKKSAGEEWLEKKVGSYLPGVYEEVVDLVPAYTLKPEEGLHIKATHNCVDALKKKRSAGEMWLVTGEQINSYIPEIGEEVMKAVQKTVLRKGQFCVVSNPVDRDGVCQLGKEKLWKGVVSFFLHPGETIKHGIQEQFILGPDQSIVLRANCEFTDKSAGEKPKERKCGDRWMIRGPRCYIPPIELDVVEQGDGQLVRKAIPLGENEGIYVRNLQSGEVKAIMGPQSYLLTEHEQLWQKELPEVVEKILQNGGGFGEGDIRKLAYFESSIDSEFSGEKPRNKTRVIRYRCPHNTAVQVYKYQEKVGRVVFGPDMAILGPHEDFNVLSLSAGKPKKENALQTICLMLGPDYITDIIEVETSDHARLRIRLAFNNFFEFEQGNEVEEKLIFSVPDFIGFACRQVGSRIRGAVSRVKFDEFHRHSMKLLQVAVFGTDDKGQMKSKLKFEANKLVITNIDIQSVEPVDQTMKDSLLKSVQMAIEIATSSVERTAGHEAARKEQEAKGHLERQRLVNQKEAEKARSILYELRAQTSAVESTGQAKAEAQAQAEKLLIEGQSSIDEATLKQEAENIIHSTDLEIQTMLREAELSYQQQQDTLELDTKKRMAEIEVEKFASMVDSIGIETITKIAIAGPASKVNLLKSLGIKSTLITDGNSPINLFQTSEGLVAGNTGKGKK
ncbi:major vault protein-like [Apostichopus japonicus]|uniref:major vault protein-like n=1 Tax=Stichopus japonicus TaxID=307972 RepID=UPI003AB45170